MQKQSMFRPIRKIEYQIPYMRPQAKLTVFCCKRPLAAHIINVHSARHIKTHALTLKTKIFWMMILLTQSIFAITKTAFLLWMVMH